jgi:hypothetical protein
LATNFRINTITVLRGGGNHTNNTKKNGHEAGYPQHFWPRQQLKQLKRIPYEILKKKQARSWESTQSLCVKKQGFRKKSDRQRRPFEPYQRAYGSKGL